MSTSMDLLSVELLDNIVSFVQPRSALFELALVSRKFNSLVTPYLYQHIFLDSNSSDGGNRHILPLTFLILQNPSIASLVKSFTFRGSFQDEESWSGPGDTDDDSRLPWPEHPDRENILRRLIKKISHSEEEEDEWLEKVLPQYTPWDDAIFSLLLISLPNLRRLDLEITNYNVAYLERIFNRIAFSAPPFDLNPVFTQLSDIMIAGNDDRYPTDYVLLYPCCRFPAIKRLYGHRLGAEEDSPHLSEITSVPSPIETSELHDSKLHTDGRFQSSGLNNTTSTIETFELRDSKLHLSDLPIILGALKSPQKLIIHIGNSWAWTPIRTPDILSALLIHATSVRRLALDHEDYYPFEEGVGPDDNADPVSFIGFTAFTHLRVAPLFLFGHEDMIHAPESGSGKELEMLYRLRGAFPWTLESLGVRAIAMGQEMLTPPARDSCSWTLLRYGMARCKDNDYTFGKPGERRLAELPSKPSKASNSGHPTHQPLSTPKRAYICYLYAYTGKVVSMVGGENQLTARKSDDEKQRQQELRQWHSGKSVDWTEKIARP
ncbi:hypothetical protein O988_06450 [Pseudogymnoascus sp. VKM F-3808]|nr:hypothetical protein O988_06450 [Pseudogymnoascus sp. VKM F-3808]